MSRKSLIFCFSALAAMIVMIVAAVAFLYRDHEPDIPVQSRYELAYAVPSNAVMACFLSDASKLSSPVLSSFDFHKELVEFMKSDAAGALGKSPMALSLYYSGSLTPMYIFDAGKIKKSDSCVDALAQFARVHGYHAEYVNCSEFASKEPLASKSIVILAKTNALISITKSHLGGGRSMMEAPGFVEAAKYAPEDVLVYSYDKVKMLYERAALRSHFAERYPDTSSSEYSAVASFFGNLAQWGVVALDDNLSFDIVQSYKPNSDFMSVLNHASPAVSEVSKMLPSYTRFALSLPMRDAKAYLTGYSTFLDASQKKENSSSRKLIDKLRVKEVASASFASGNDVLWVNLVKIERADTMLLRKTGDKSFGKKAKVRPYAFAGHLASVFGKYFRLDDESHFAYMNGWLVTGSKKAVEEYVSGMALSYDLKTYMSDAGKGDLMAERVNSCVVYINIPKGDTWLAGVVGKETCAMHDALKGGAEYSPIVMSVFNKGGVMHTDIACSRLTHKRSRAPKFDRDTVVVVPSGPYKVINSITGNTNIFYQQASGAICLKEESGKGLWGVPFKKTICGTAHNIDYYSNGKKQILFGAGSELFLFDCLGRPVYGFPVDLGKEILLGPDVYDFNGSGSYNVLVLHKDNTVEMYDLCGKKPESWKGMTCKETIKSLPEKLVVGGKVFWVVRTSIQTLIYPFNGGKPLNTLKGDQMFLPDAKVKAKNATTVEAKCYDGKVRAIKVK